MPKTMAGNHAITKDEAKGEAIVMPHCRSKIGKVTHTTDNPTF
ncbi:hypothetical protein GCM10007359_21850 [Rothia aerolata]|uniref:Uncharacterized protein n=1 Tax=Rothia aerolata TaxID=1812262 RepID=A0A917IXZ0_9MICC|nr:hypothetical protein GCM10007359_21850 [Rothia aerolata]